MFPRVDGRMDFSYSSTDYGIGTRGQVRSRKVGEPLLLRMVTRTVRVWQIPVIFVAFIIGLKDSTETAILFENTVFVKAVMLVLSKVYSFSSLVSEQVVRDIFRSFVY